MAEINRMDPGDEIALECIRAIAQAKGLPADSITLASTLDELALDSLDLVSLSFDLEERYAVEVPEHRLHAIQSVGGLVAEIQEARAKKAAQAAATP